MERREPDQRNSQNASSEQLTSASRGSPDVSSSPRGRHRHRDDCENCRMGFSPRARSPSSPFSLRSPLGLGGRYSVDLGDAAGDNEDNVHSVLGDSVADGVLGRKTNMSTTKWLAQRHGVRHSLLMYVVYYLPFLKWVRQYRREYLMGDLVAALTMASFYIPMSLSYASNLGHVPPVQGMYSFVFNPLIYAFLGTCPQMVVGPEAAGSLLTGNVVRDSINKGRSRDDASVQHAQIAGVVTGVAGAILFIAGSARLGFLDNVLSRPFLRGFISAIGFIILVDQLIPEMGLAHLANGATGVEHGSCVAKVMFLVQNVKNAHGLTCAVSFGSFAIIMICRYLNTKFDHATTLLIGNREIKRRLQPRYPGIAYIPDRFAIVVLATVLTWTLRWDHKGLAVLGDVKSQGDQLFSTHFPFDFSHMRHLESALSTAFLVSLLGFFESSVAAKSLGAGPPDGIQNISLSANRELVGLGVANVIGGVFMALPAFGGYGRSKVNAATGGKTPMSSVFLSLITIICILVLLPAFYYIPILGRVHGTTDRFENAEADPDRLEFIEGCLIVKIPEPLTAFNTGDLRNRLRRLEEYGTSSAHPALPRVRHAENNKNIIFDAHGVTKLDGAGTQVLYEILNTYKEKGVRIFFCRIPSRRSSVWGLFESSGIIELCGGYQHFVDSVEQALHMTELESVTEYYRDHPEDDGRFDIG
ncbi:MAG: hypothetical protein M1831_004455 [Alyxoria varia]|nr:MAG: hypothetical protein M1831_004455 [Alyxoria varia]